MDNVDAIREERARLAAVLAEAAGAEEKIAALDQVLALYDTRADPVPSPAPTRQTRTRKRRPRPSLQPATYPCSDPDCDRTFGTSQGAALHATRAHRG